MYGVVKARVRWVVDLREPFMHPRGLKQLARNNQSDFVFTVYLCDPNIQSLPV